MNNLFGRTLTSLLLGVLAFGPAARAQHSERVIKANIPFEFSVGSRTFPAGEYRLVSVSPAVLQVRDAEDRCLTVVLTNAVETLKAPDSSKLHFYNQDGRYALTEIWQEDFTIGQQLQLPKSTLKVGKRKSGRTEIVAADTSR
jgi:hypothetical protein